MYINWHPHDEGNILYNDKKFVTLLYQWHDDEFTEYSKVSDAGNFFMKLMPSAINSFMAEADTYSGREMIDFKSVRIVY